MFNIVIVLKVQKNNELQFRHSHLLSTRQIKRKASSQTRLAITDSQSSSPLLTETLKKRGPKFDNRSPESLKTMRTTCIDDVLRIVSTPSSRDERLKAISLLTNKQPEPERGHNAKDGKECYIVPPTPAGNGFHGEENPGNDNKLDSTYTTNTEKNTKALGQGLGAPKTGVGATRWASSGPPSPVRSLNVVKKRTGSVSNPNSPDKSPPFLRDSLNLGRTKTRAFGETKISKPAVTSTSRVQSIKENRFKLGAIKNGTHDKQGPVSSLIKGSKQKSENRVWR